MLLAAAVVAETPRGWGGTLGILAGLAGIYAVIRADEYCRKRWGKGARPSPAKTGPPAPRETRSSRPVSSHVSPDETPVEGGERGWWGAITKMPDGSFRRVWKKAQHIAATGDSPPQEYGDEPVGAQVPDDEIDIPLAIEAAAPGEVPDDAPALDDGEEFVVRARQETREEYVERCRAAGIDKALIVKGLQEHYSTSRATAYRLVG